ncbi:MAG: cytochrome c3 family protein [Pirellula sp.]
MPLTGKQRAQRIDRQYHKLVDPFLVRKRWLGVIGFSLALAYSTWLFSNRGPVQISAGELSKKHAAWNHTGCEECHVPFSPIRKDAFGGDSPAVIAKNNLHCNGKCHTVTGHFERQLQPGVLASESCGSCHREHMGSEHSLVQIPDRDCKRCHQKLESVTATGIPSSSVFNFSDESGHPKFPFEATGKDPGTIKFSHSQHLRPGQPTTPGGTDAKGLINIPEKYRAQYNKRVDDNKLIQLKCSDCHSRDIEVPGYEELENGAEGLKPDRMGVQTTSHLLYKPVEFNKHCIACHDLDGVEHGLDRTKTKQSIDNLLPLRQNEFLRTQPADAGLTNEEINQRQLRLETLLSSKTDGCSKCHSRAVEDSPALVEPSGVMQRWLKHAGFSHGAHLMVSCKECHSQAYAMHGGRVDSELNADQVMIPGIETCRKCHIQSANKRSVEAAKNKHVATAECVDCHRYHVDPPKSAIPSKSASIDIEQWRTFLARGPFR